MNQFGSVLNIDSFQYEISIEIGPEGRVEKFFTNFKKFPTEFLQSFHQTPEEGVFEKAILEIERFELKQDFQLFQFLYLLRKSLWERVQLDKRISKQSFDPVVCRCYGITQKSLLDFFAENPNVPAKEIPKLTKAATLCGSCLSDVDQLYQKYLDSSELDMSEKSWKNCQNDWQRLLLICGVLENRALAKSVKILSFDNNILSLQFNSTSIGKVDLERKLHCLDLFCQWKLN